jgi:hypothetical protein
MVVGVGERAAAIAMRLVVLFLVALVVGGCGVSGEGGPGAKTRVGAFALAGQPSIGAGLAQSPCTHRGSEPARSEIALRFCVGAEEVAEAGGEAAAEGAAAGGGGGVGIDPPSAGGGGGGGGGGNPLDGTTYTPKVIQQMSGPPGEFHSFPESVDGFANQNHVTHALGGDGKVYTHVNIPGGYGSAEGSFHYIIDDQSMINHRQFEPY